jgi:hypothetical protein
MDNTHKPWEPEGWDASERPLKLVVSGESSSSEDEDEDEDEEPLMKTRTRPPPKYKTLVVKEELLPE